MKSKIDGRIVKSDGKFRQLFQFQNLPEKIRDEISERNGWAEDCTFFKYKNEWYCLDDFIRVSDYDVFHEFMDSALQMTYFSGLGIKLSDDGEKVKVFYYYE